MDPENDNAAWFLEMVGTEVARATALHPPMNSPHEAFAVIFEELDEFWDECRKKSSERNPQDMLTELVQTAAMCARAASDLGLLKAPRLGGDNE